MWIALAIMAAMQLVQGMQQASAEKEAAKKQEEAAQRQEALAAEAKGIQEQNAQRQEAQNVESERRQQAQQLKDEANARAAAFASGFVADDDTGSIALSLAAQQKENKRQLEYTKAADASQVDILRKQAVYTYDQGMSQAETTRAQAELTKNKAKQTQVSAFLNAAKTGMSAYNASGGFGSNMWSSAGAGDVNSNMG